MANITELIVRLKDEVSANSSKISQSLGGLNNQIRNFAGALGVTFGAGAIVGLIKNIVDLGCQLQDLSDRTGISAQTLSGLKSTLEEGGVSIEQFAKGISFAQKSLGDITGTGFALQLGVIGLNATLGVAGDSILRGSAATQYMKAMNDKQWREAA